MFGTVAAAVMSFALLIPTAAWAVGGGGQWTLEEGGTTCFNLLVDGPVEGPRIVATRQPLQESFGEREIVYVARGGADAAVGSLMEVVRNTGNVSHPVGGTAGGVLEVLGVVEVIDANEETLLVRVVGACREFEVGDVLRPTSDNVMMPEEWPRLPVFDADRLVTPEEADAYVVMGALESVLAGEGDLSRQSLTQYEIYAERDLLVIDQGADATWEFGDLALVYRDRVYADSNILRQALVEPLVIGRGVIVRADDTSAVMQVTDSVTEMQLGDRARNVGTIWDYVNHPPTITCRSERDQVRYGESVRLSAEVSDPDGDATTITWRTGAGSLSSSEGATVTWTASDLDQATRDSGRVDVVATADDGRDGGMVSCTVPLAVVPPGAGGAAAAGPEGADVLEFTCPEFPLGVTEVDNRCKALLDDVALRLRQDPRATAELVGHSDSSGSDETNAATSQARADSARDYLVETHGIDASRISTSGLGSAMPIADNETPEGRLQNRRVEIRVTLPGGEEE